MGNISGIAGNDVYVRVPYRLARNLATVHANVEALRCEFLLKDIFDLSDEVEGIGVLVGSHLPDGYHMSTWNNQGMPLGDGKAIEECQ